MVFGILHIRNQRIEFFAAVVENLDRVVLRQNSAIVPQMQINHIFVVMDIRIFEIELLILKQVHLMGDQRFDADAGAAFPFEERLFPKFAAEQKIDKEAENRNEKQYQNPGPCGSGITPFKKNKRSRQENID
jgi:hypothetical protein